MSLLSQFYPSGAGSVFGAGIAGYIAKDKIAGAPAHLPDEIVFPSDVTNQMTHNSAGSVWMAFVQNYYETIQFLSPVNLWGYNSSAYASFYGYKKAEDLFLIMGARSNTIQLTQKSNAFLNNNEVTTLEEINNLTVTIYEIWNNANLIFQDLTTLTKITNFNLVVHAPVTPANRNNISFLFQGCALDQASVDDILEGVAGAIDNYTAPDAWSKLKVDVSGGSNASPSGAGLAAAATITSVGGTVTTN